MNITAGHILYIPLVLAIGVVLGFIFGGRAARDAIAFEQKKAEEREARKRERQERQHADG